ncbi:hypothetical protein DPMN_044628 [Dreissena polymorpha]|uniref:UEV domain-containing protein n=1 Tax=Dreissena polymorpha TaxID=45954 RepID=A0A9D4HZ02_DREPO|nr:hypothetical protein DPMN_044628 [Dreissena polymorpha]
MSSYEPFLRSSLQKYKHPDVAKFDILNAITIFGDLVPKYDEFGFEDGSTKMLVLLDGTIPVTYQGKGYNIPILVCLLDSHPNSPPIVFVKLSSNMLIRPGQNVQQNGKVNLQYLREWKYPNYNLLGMIQMLVIAFGEQPPLYSRPQPQPALTGGFAAQRPSFLSAGKFNEENPALFSPYRHPHPDRSVVPSCPRSMSIDADQATEVTLQPSMTNFKNSKSCKGY